MADKSESERPGRSIFLDVFKRADKTDDGALSWEEFKSFFCDGILSNEDLEKLFHDIDTHKTNNLDTSEVCDYFMKEMGHFTDVFAGLEDMNKAIMNALIQTAKEYPDKSFIGKFTTRFLLKEILGQLNSLEHHIDVAVDKIDEDESEQRPSVVPAEVTNSSVRGGRMKRKMNNFTQQTSVEANVLKHALSSEVHRLEELIDKLESKVKFDVVDEEEVNAGDDKLVVLVSRKFKVAPRAEAEFRSSLKSYIGLTSSQMSDGCLHLGVRTISSTNVFMLYEIWASSEDLHRHFTSKTSKAFMHDNIDNLEQPEEYNKMAVPASWWRG